MKLAIEAPPLHTLTVAGRDERFPVNRVFCVGRNYAAHAREMGHDPDREPPFFFTKPADAIVLCNQVENAVFVIESGRTRKGHAKAALKRLHQAGIHPIGVILTKIDAYHDLYGYGTSYYQYAKPAIAAKKTAEV